MSILDKLGGLLGGGLGSKIAEIVGNRIENKQQAELTRLEIEKAIGERAHELEMALIASESEIAKSQSEVNKAEAASGNLFASSWRPLAGYVCVLGLAYQFLIQPLISWVSGVNMWPGPPQLDLGDLITLLGGMLGLGTLRTTERLKGVIPQGK
jgi:hypothetical protein